MFPPPMLVRYKNNERTDGRTDVHRNVNTIFEQKAMIIITLKKKKPGEIFLKSTLQANERSERL